MILLGGWLIGKQLSHTKQATRQIESTTKTGFYQTSWWRFELANRGFVGCCRFIWECGGALPWAKIWSREFVNKLVECEAFNDPMRIGFTPMKGFCSRFLIFSVFPGCKDSPQTVMLWWEWLGRSKCRATGLDASVPFFFRFFFLHLVGVCESGPPIFSLSFLCPTELISSYLDKVMAPIVKWQLSYTKDSNRAPEIFRTFNFSGENKIIFAMDITSSYTLIPNNEGLQALKYFLNQRPIEKPRSTMLNAPKMKPNKFESKTNFPLSLLRSQVCLFVFLKTEDESGFYISAQNKLTLTKFTNLYSL